MNQHGPMSNDGRMPFRGVAQHESEPTRLVQPSFGVESCSIGPHPLASSTIRSGPLRLPTTCQDFSRGSVATFLRTVFHFRRPKIPHDVVFNMPFLERLAKVWCGVPEISLARGSERPTTALFPVTHSTPPHLLCFRVRSCITFLLKFPFI
jgi:hypothetical protein